MMMCQEQMQLCEQQLPVIMVSRIDEQLRRNLGLNEYEARRKNNRDAKVRMRAYISHHRIG